MLFRQNNAALTKEVPGMKKVIAFISLLACILSLAGCFYHHPSGFEGDKLYVNLGYETFVYERYAPGVGTLTKKTVLDTFITETAIEGIVWDVYSVEEYPDLSYVLVISGTNSSWTYRISKDPK